MLNDVLKAVPRLEHPEEERSRLFTALEDEFRLLTALRATFARMNDALSASDAAAVEDAVYASHRLMHTLVEARRRRQTLAEIGDLHGGRQFRLHGPAVHRAYERLVVLSGVLDREIRARCGALAQLAATGSDTATACRVGPAGIKHPLFEPSAS